MALSPFRAHKQRVIAAQEWADSPQMDAKSANQYELMLIQLAEHRRRLKAIQSIERKIEVKRTLLPDYVAYIDGVLEGDSGRQDDVLMTIMIWRIDTGDIEGALTIAEYAIHHDLQTPDRYERSTACLIAEEVADTSIKAIESQNPVNPELTARVIALTQDEDMFDQVRAKLLKAHGLGLLKAGNLADCVDYLKRALELDEKCGVKKIIEQTEREIRKQNSTQQEETPVVQEALVAQEEPPVAQDAATAS
ncbi:MAG: phage terminase small subunit [Tolumonas sp.]